MCIRDSPNTMPYWDHGRAHQQQQQQQQLHMMYHAQPQYHVPFTTPPIMQQQQQQQQYYSNQAPPTDDRPGPPAMDTRLHQLGQSMQQSPDLVRLRKYMCGYCNTVRVSASIGNTGRIRIRCDCGGKHHDNVPRMHGRWTPTEEEPNTLTSRNFRRKTKRQVLAEQQPRGGLKAKKKNNSPGKAAVNLNSGFPSQGFNFVSFDHNHYSKHTQISAS
eukprot:TRINITY_DN468_c0_g1_i2.p2 TRINITY_DN468_c0_g1~~TRINITY_DN468_c0_g1_i2.p2  ORF type:complete len:216 (+),score=43.41 TRINITY_DN468_c0_g1_i2:105-752(+)